MVSKLSRLFWGFWPSYMETFRISPRQKKNVLTDLADLAKRTDIALGLNRPPPILRNKRHDGEILRVDISSALMGERGLSLAKGRLQVARAAQ
jgi:hypothetical protein